jgi:hypothetical protein
LDTSWLKFAHNDVNIYNDEDTGWTSEISWFDYRQGLQIYEHIFCKTYRPAVDSIKASLQWEPENLL